MYVSSCVVEHDFMNVQVVLGVLFYRRDNGPDELTKFLDLIISVPNVRRPLSSELVVCVQAGNRAAEIILHTI